MGCTDGYSLNSDNLCQLKDEHCLKYDQLHTRCLKCVKGYKKDREGRCKYADKHCADFNEFGNCGNCDRLYFINPYSKCQLRDPQCRTYTNGFCSECRPYHFVNRGGCLPNLHGCKRQESTDKCLECDSGYTLSGGRCTAAIKKLTWNDFDMDFFDSDCEEEFKESKEFFTVGVDNKLNLVPAWGQGFSLFYSSCAFN